MSHIRICFDLDGTICTNKQIGQTYADVIPLPGAVESIKRLKAAGHYIIIHTARGMRTYDSNEGKILANMEYLYDWLKKWDISVDEIRIGKPDCDIFVDDKGFHHNNWEETECHLHEFADRATKS